MKLLLLLSLALFVGSNTPIEVKTQGTEVYICTGSSATKYHKSSNCRGLNRCSGSILKLSMSSAKAKGYYPCKICYK